MLDALQHGLHVAGRAGDEAGLDIDQHQRQLGGIDQQAHGMRPSSRKRR
jgi:hypothetical protein